MTSPTAPRTTCPCIDGHPFHTECQSPSLHGPAAPRKLYSIATEIRRTWPAASHTATAAQAAPAYAAEPYLYAMSGLVTMADRFGEDDAADIVLRFLGNATSWRGDDARRIKAELRAMLAAARA